MRPRHIFAFLASAVALSAANVVPVIVIHGGGGVRARAEMSAVQEAEYRAVLAKALQAGYTKLTAAAPALDAVEAALNVMEDSPLFNAGKGSSLNRNGVVECDASIMEGSTFKAAGVAGVQHIKNPISLARLVMEKSPHVLMAGVGAEEFALSQGVPLVPNSYLQTPHKIKSLRERLENDIPYGKKENAFLVPRGPEGQDKGLFGTTGCVVLDQHGNLAAGTTTGGREGKLPGRVGDSPIIGAGTYANNATCAVSSTGLGEYVMRKLTAYDISAMIEYKGMSLDTAVEAARQKVVDMGGGIGLIAVNKKGEISMRFTGDGMYRGYIRGDGKPVVKIYGD
jgi:L-asparaginase / beta-aspartyl-peptidase